MNAVVGADRATQLWFYTRSEQFADEYLGGVTFDKLVEESTTNGVFDAGALKSILDIGYNIPTDEHGEPTAFWLLNTLNVQNRKEESKSEDPNAAPESEGTIMPVNENMFGHIKNKKTDTRMSVNDLVATIKALYDNAASHPQHTYDLTWLKATNPNKTNKTGYTPTELANMLTLFPIPANVRFNPQFETLLLNTTAYILADFDFNDVPFLNYVEDVARDIRTEYYVQKRDVNGDPTGEYFTSEQQAAAVDTVVYHVWHIVKGLSTDELAERPVASILNEVYKMLVGQRDRYRQRVALPSHVTDVMAENRADAMQEVLNAWSGISERVVYKLASYGLRTKNRKKSALEDIESVATTEQLENDVDRGRGGTDWSESSFELDPRDTASARIKLFLASISDVELGQEKEPTRISLPFRNPEIRKELLGEYAIGEEDFGRKVWTVRRREEIDRFKEQGIVMKPGRSFLAEIDGVKFIVGHIPEKKAKDGTVISAARDGKRVTEADLNNPYYQDIAERETGAPLRVGDVLLPIEEWHPKTDVKYQKENYLGFPQLVDFEQLFQELLENAVTVSDMTVDNFLATLEREGQKYRPVLLEVADAIRQQPEDVQRELLKVMSKQYQEYAILLISKERSGFLTTTDVNANRGSAVRSIITHWKENQKNAGIITTDQAGNKIIDANKAQSLWDRLMNIKARIDNNDLPNIHTELKPFIQNLFEVNGIDMPEAALNDLLENTAEYTKGTKLAGHIHSQFGFTTDGRPTGMFSAIISKLAGKQPENVDDDEDTDPDIEDDDDAVTYLLNNNPLYTEQTTMRILASLTYQYSPGTAASSVRNSENKSIYAFGMNTHLSASMKRLKESSEFRDKLRTTYLGKHSWLLDALDNDNTRNRFGLRYVDGLKEVNKKNARGIVRTEMSTREQLVFAMGEFAKKGRNFGNFISLTHSDKTTTPIFTGIRKHPIGSVMHELPAKTAEAVFQTFLGEYERIKMWTADNKTNNDSFNKGGKYFYFMEHLNRDYLLKMVADRQLSMDQVRVLWNDDGSINTNAPALELKKFVLQMFMKLWVNKEVTRLTALMKDEGMFSGDVKMFDKDYFEKNKENAGLKPIYNNGKVDGYVDKKSDEVLTITEAAEQFARWAAKDFVVNGFLVNTALASLFFGDPALAFKKSKDPLAKDFDHVEATMKEYQKRLAGDIAPGQDPIWDSGPNEEYTAITLQDDARVHEYLEHLAAYKGAEIESTDAQELTTVREHLYVLKAMGLIKTDIYNEMVAIIEDGLRTPSKYYEFTEPRHLAVVMQIMKPVYFTQHFGEIPGVAAMHYVKSSAMPLYPPMTKYFEIDDLRVAMEGDGTPETHIPRANFATAKKLGAPNGKGVKIFNKDGSIDVSVNSQEWKNAQQTMRRGGLRIQQEVPYDELKGEILMGSQDNKLFVQGIDHLKSFRVRGVEGRLSGKDLRMEKENIRRKMIDHQLNDFWKRAGSVSKLMEMLEQEAMSRNYPPNDIIMLKRRVESMLQPDEKGRPTQELAIPLFFNPSADRFESLLMSMVKKIGQIYFPGKSFIQASSAGFRFKEKLNWEQLTQKDKEGIVWVEGYDGGELKTMTEGQPAQVLMPFNFTIEGVAAKATDFTKVGEDGRLYLDTAKVPKELIEVIGFRIPTQKHNSMLPIQVVGFLPATMGDTIVVPGAITRQMGSDFDVDKLFVYRRPYKYVPQMTEFLEGEEVNTPGHFETIEYSDENPSMEQLFTRYFDLHWAVLTAPAMYETVMSPLDKPDLKNEAARAAQGQQGRIEPFFSPRRQIQDFVSQKDAKVMVGISSLAVVFTAVVENLNLKVREPYMGIRFRAEGEQATIRATEISGKADGKYYTFVKDNGEAVPVDIINGQMVDINGVEIGPAENATIEYRSKLDDLTSLQSEFLDHAKNRTIDFLNINLSTVYPALAFAMLSDTNGNKATLKHLSFFLRQPALVELTHRLARSQDSLSTSFSSDAMGENIAALIQEHLDAAMRKGFVLTEQLPIFIEDRGFDIIDIDDLRANFEEEGNPSIEYHLSQIGMLMAFSKLHELGRALGSLQSTMNQDPRGPGRNMLSAIDAHMNGVQLQLDKNDIVANTSDLFGTEQGYIHQVELNTALDAYSELLPYQALVPILSDIKAMTGKQNLSVDTQIDIASEYRSYIFSMSTLGLSENPSRDRARLLYDTDAGPALATRVQQAQNTWGRNNYFLKRLQPQQAETPNTPSYVFYLASRASVLDDQENASAFLELLRSQDPVQKQLAEDLVRYAYLTGGVSGGFSFIRYIPVDYLLGLPFAARLREVNRGLTNYVASEDTAGAHHEFLAQWIRHNPSQAPKLTEEMMAGLEEFSNVKWHPGVIPEKLTLSLPSQPGIFKPLTRPEGEAIIYPKYLSFFSTTDKQWILYERLGDSSRKYQRIDTLGSSYSTEYHHGGGYRRSIFTANHAMIRPKSASVYVTHTLPEAPVHNTKDGDFATNATHKLRITKPTFKGTDAVQLLNSLSVNTEVPHHLRVLTSLFTDIANAVGRNLPLSYTFEPKNQYGGNDLGVTTPEGKMTIYTHKHKNAKQLAGTIVHETIHGLTHAATRKSIPQLSDHPGVQAALEGVKEVQKEALEALLQEIEEAGYTMEQIEAARKTGQSQNETIARYANLYYAMRNYDEFMAGVLEGGAQGGEYIHRWLNSKTSKLDPNTSLLDRFLSFLTEFLRAIEHSLGIDIREKSMLSVAVKRTFKLLQEIKADENLKPSTRLSKAISDTYFGGNPMQYIDTLSEAEELARQIEEDFPHAQAVVRGDEVNGYIINVDAKDSYSRVVEVETEVTNPFDKLHAKIYEKLKEIQTSLAKNKADVNVLSQRAMIKEMEALANHLKATQTLDEIKVIAVKQLDWAEAVLQEALNHESPEINRVMTAYRLTSIWTDLIRTIYAGTYAAELEEGQHDQEFTDIQDKAVYLQNRFIDTVMKDAFKTIAQSNVTDEDFKKVTDSNKPSSIALDVSRAKDKLIQEAGLTLQNAHRAYLEDSQRLITRIQDFEAEAKKVAAAKGLDVQDLYAKYFNTDGYWGLVSKESAAYHKWKASITKKLRKDVERIQKEIADKTDRETAMKGAYRSYWEELSKNAFFVDVRVLFDDDANIKDTDDAKEMLARVEEHQGKEAAADIIKQAQQKYKKFLTDKADIYEMYDIEVEEGRMTEDAAKDAKNAWDTENNPKYKMSTATGGRAAAMNVGISEKYLVLVLKKDAKTKDGSSFYDSNYAAIQADADMKKLYTKIEAFMAEFKNNLPYYMDHRLGSNFMAAIRKELVTSLTNMPEYVKGLPAKAVDAITAGSIEEAQQSRTTREIPLMYTEDPLKDLPRPKKGATAEEWAAYRQIRQERLKDYTTDLPRIFEVFGMMSYHFKHMSAVRDTLDLQTEVLRKIDRDMRSGTTYVDKNGKMQTVASSLTNSLETLDYTRDVLMYKRTKNLEGGLGEIHRKKDPSVQKKMKELRAELVELEKKKADNAISEDEYKMELAAIQTEMAKWDVRKIYASKVADVAITWTQLKALSYNPMSAIANMTFGLISASIHANGRQDFTWKELKRAMSIMMNSTGRALRLSSLAGSDSNMSAQSRKVLAIMDRMNVMGELTDAEYMTANVRKKKGIRSTLSPYQMMRSGDYFVKGLNTVAVLLKEKVKVPDGNGGEKEISVWEAIDENGNWKYEDMPDWQAENPADQKKWNALRNKVIAVNKIIMGNQDKSSPIVMKRSMLWRLVGQFRLSWLAEGIASRFEDEHEDVQLGRIRKGRYRTYADIGWKQSIGVLARQALTVLPGVKMDPFSGVVNNKTGELIGETDKANMRRNLAEIGWYLAMYGVAMMLGALASGGDDDEQAEWFRFWANMATRSYMDIGLYGNPKIFDQVIGTTAPALGTIKDVLNFFEATGKYMTEEDYEFQRWLLKLTKAGFIPQTTLVNKVNTMMKKDLSELSR